MSNSKRNLSFIAGVAVSGLATFAFFKNRQERKEDSIRYQLADVLKSKFDNDEMYGYWIDFSATDDGQYICGVNILDDDTESIDSYTFTFDPINNKINDVKLLNKENLTNS